MFNIKNMMLKVLQEEKSSSLQAKNLLLVEAKVFLVIAMLTYTHNYRALILLVLTDNN